MSGAYYNEIDPYAAAWLRNLIKKGLIADGEVDGRSIVDVRHDDVRGFTQCHFFAGIGVWSCALRLAGWTDERPVWTGSCPCQPFSAAGKGKGFNDERHLWPEFHRLISQCHPPVVLGEQVASKDGLAWLDTVQSDMEASGYAIGAADLCAAGIGAPHIRQRLWFVGERLADATGVKCERQPNIGPTGILRTDVQSSERRDRFGDLRAGSGWLANADEQQLDGCRDAGTGRRREPADIGADGGLADTEHNEQWSGRGTRSEDTMRDEPWSEPSGCGAAGGVADTRADGSQGRVSGRSDEERGTVHGSAGRGGADRGTGPTNGHWRDADWLFCRDGKWRPVEPGTFPLAHGAPARVGRLRAYGNAIVPQAAAEVIGSFMECRP